MSSNDSSFSCYDGQIGQGIVDNGPKWGSYVKRNPDGSFPFDKKMQDERPKDWEKMIEERVKPLYETMRNPPRKIPKKWAEGKPRPN
jgi:hypothetical protein